MGRVDSGAGGHPVFLRVLGQSPQVLQEGCAPLTSAEVQPKIGDRDVPPQLAATQLLQDRQRVLSHGCAAVHSDLHAPIRALTLTLNPNPRAGASTSLQLSHVRSIYGAQLRTVCVA